MGNVRNSYRLKISLNVIFAAISFLLLVSLVFNVFRKVSSGSELSFTAFLNWLGSVNSTTISINIQDFAVRGNWGIVDGLRQFFNVFAQIFGVIVFLGANLINLLIFVCQFVAFIFA